MWVSVINDQWRLCTRLCFRGLGSLGSGTKIAHSTLGTVAFGALSGGIGAALSGGDFWQGAGTGASIALLNHAAHRVAGDEEIIKSLTPEQRKQLEQIKSGTRLTTEALKSTGLDKVLDNWIENTALGKNLKVGIVDYLSMGGEVYYDRQLEKYNGITKNEFTFRFISKSITGVVSSHFGSLAGSYVGAQYGGFLGGFVGTLVGTAAGFYIDNTYFRGIKYFDHFMKDFAGYLQRQVIFNYNKGF